MFLFHKLLILHSTTPSLFDRFDKSFCLSALYATLLNDAFLRSSKHLLAYDKTLAKVFLRSNI